MGSLGKGRREPEESSDPCADPWMFEEPAGWADTQAGQLHHTVETEIIPRLMMLHRNGFGPGPRPAERQQSVALDGDAVKTFTERILRGHEPALDYLKALVADGVSLEVLCLEVLAPTARRLGELWNADLCDFTDVTLALGRLQLLLRSVTDRMDRLGAASGHGHRIVFTTMPGEQHTFGMNMVCDFFRSSGWEVWDESANGSDELIERVRSEHFDVVGLTIGSERNVEPLKQLIRALRQQSRNPRLGILVGGPLLLCEPHVAKLVGADATASDARQAILTAQRLIQAQDASR